MNHPLPRVPAGQRDLGIIALVPDDWSGIVTSRHQILSRLSRRFPVVWMNPARGWREYLRPSNGFFQGDEWSEPTAGLNVFTPGWRHPLLYKPRSLSRLFQKSRLAAASRRLRNLGATRIGLYIWRDEFSGAIDLIDHDLSVYHIDDEYSFVEFERPVSNVERQLMMRVNRVIVHSPAMLAKKGSINAATTMIPNGVDFGAYNTAAPIPDDLANLKRPIIGYSGVIKQQLDLELLLQIAKARPEFSFVMVGPIYYVNGKEEFIEGLRQLKNVHFLGFKPPQALPAYVQHFDVCLMCYKVNDYTKYIYPLKLHEYLATGRPVVSSQIDAVVRTKPPVLVASSLEEWLTAIDRSLESECQAADARQRRVETAMLHDWDKLVGRVIEVFEGATSG